ncbi:hypothetical protein MCAP1_003035 [Malassezia caprae]|uniref:Uncharacterized protein n=1 Tax=Malassezia caprae TaxID=1381934 RepID=A0AAF0IWM1_9BASI|nr:hypothetical protein MCAP1_003035 [Malassezia caprae]
MAKGAQKRLASTNARAVQTLALGFAITNTLYVIAQLVRYRSVRWPAAVLVPYLLSEAIAAGLAWQLVGMARSGADLAQAGLTAYMFDIVYITWFVHGSTALVSRYFWWTYLVIPLYALYLLYTHILAPYVLGRSRAPPPATQGKAPDAREPALSRRQAKLQARQARGAVRPVRHA